MEFKVRFEMYTGEHAERLRASVQNSPLTPTTTGLRVAGDGTGADGMCVSIGGNDLAGRPGEDGVAEGVALCFDEWANDGDHGVEIMYNGSPVWQELASCGNRQGCDPVSWFE